jgi:pyridoxal phosphate enzyme (YggS family)
MPTIPPFNERNARGIEEAPGLLAERLERLRAAIEAAAKGRAVKLVAVSKFHSQTAVKAALAAGQFSFGENRVQEAKAKFMPLRAEESPVDLSLIGPLQTNKVHEAVALFDTIQTVDRPHLAEALSRAFERTSRRPRLYVEVNVGYEPQKAGLVPEALERFLGDCRDRWGMKIEGLMAIPPAGRPPGPFFRQVVALADRFLLPHRSIGMSGDFEEAIRAGATEVRVGTALFGAR